VPSLADLKRDPERLHQAATLLETENKKLIEKNLELQARVDALEGRDPGTLQMRRQGLRIDSQTLWDQLFALSEHVQPAYEALHRHVLSHPVVGADETTWRLMGKKAVTNTKRWQVWALSSPDAVVYQLHPSRGADAAAQLLQDFSGTVMCDGYSAYQALAKRHHGFKLAHC
jgi:hypothetical protein